MKISETPNVCIDCSKRLRGDSCNPGFGSICDAKDPLSDEEVKEIMSRQDGDVVKSAIQDMYSSSEAVFSIAIEKAKGE